MEQSVNLLFLLSGCVVNQLLSRRPPPLEPITDRVIRGEDGEMNSEKQRDGDRERKTKGGAED